MNRAPHTTRHGRAALAVLLMTAALVGCDVALPEAGDYADGPGLDGGAGLDGSADLDGSSGNAGAASMAPGPCAKKSPSAGADSAASGGVAMAQGVGALVAGDGEVMALRAVTVEVSASAGMVAMTITHTFHNPLKRQLEGTFRFTAPPGAIITGLRMETDGRWVEGEIIGRRRAERIYRKIVDSMRDPALLRWQGGGRLELRVFPIPAEGDKRLALRLLVPVEAVGGVQRLRYGFGAGGINPPAIGSVRVVVNGREVFQADDVARSRLLTLELGPDVAGLQPVGAPLANVEPSAEPSAELDDAADGAPGATAWLQPAAAPGDRRYLAARLDLPPPPAPPPAAARTMVVLVDRSRSALGAEGLQAQVVRALLAASADGDRFVLAAFDISCRVDPAGFSPVNAAAVDAALGWLNGVDSDGASDLGGALSCARALLHDGGGAPAGAQVVLIGDGVATWGQLDSAALVAEAEELRAPLFAVALGRAVDSASLTALTRATGGRLFTPRDAAAAGRAGRALAAVAGQGRWRDVRVTTVGAADLVGAVPVLPGALGTVFAGQRPWVVAELPPGAAVPRALLVSVAGRAQPWRLPLTEVRPATGLRQRFGTAAVADLEAISAPVEAIVAASRRYGVLSKHTALLVLESEEAYARFGIQRARAAAGDTPADTAAPRVTGADLESLHGGPSVSPDRIQPGDPEVRVPAPRDARRVTVTLPWGERLQARWEPASDHGPAAWVARFLVDLAVPEGRYPLTVEIEHADGQVVQQTLTLTVDTTAPSLRMSVRRHPRKPGVYVLRARQLAPRAGRDARGVEVRLPDGQVIALKALRLGVFVGQWRPAQAAIWPLQVELFTIDRALNQRSGVRTLRRPGSVVRLGPGRLSRMPRANEPGDLSAAQVPEVGFDVTALVRWRLHGRAVLVAGTLADGLWWRPRVHAEGGDAEGGDVSHAGRATPRAGWQRLSLAPDQPAMDRRVNRLAVDRRGDLWVATARGLYRVHGDGQVRVYGVQDGLPAADVHVVRAPRLAGQTVVLVGTANGAAALQGGDRFLPLGPKQGLPVRAVWDVVQTDDGALWLASSWGVYRWANGVAKRFSVATGLLHDDWVTALATDGRGVFVGTYQGGVTRLLPTTTEGDSTLKKRGFSAIWCGGGHVNLGGLRVARGRLWAATMEGLMAMTADDPRQLLQPVGRGGNVTAVWAR